MKQLFLPKLLGVGAALLLAASLISFPAQAQTTIDVACNTAALRTAINTANGTPQVDTLNLAADCAYNFTAGDATDPDTALPGITTPIVVNGNDATIARTGGAAFRLLYVTSTGNLTLDNATVTGGIANVSGGGIRNSGTLTVTNSTLSGNSAVYGGGIYNNDTLTVTNSTLSGNSAANFGGGIYNNGGTLTVTNSTFSGNSAENVGGGIANGGTLTVTSSTFSGNSAGFYGGGIYNDGDTATVTDSTLSTNSAVHDGGGINNGGTLTVTNSTLSINSAEDAGGGIANAGTLTVTNSPLSGNTANNGGGIANVGSGGTLTVTGSTLSGNSADASGGGIYNVDLSTVTVTNSALSSNSAGSGGSGGGIDNGGTLTVTNSTLSGNSAGYGGGIANWGGTTVTNSTLSTNSAGYGGGIYNTNGNTMTVTNSILSGNSADFGGGIFNDSSGLVFVDNSTFSGNSADFGGGVFNDSTLTVTNSIVSGNSADFGGGIYNNGTLTVSSSTLSDNNGSTDGGGIYNESGTPTVTNSIVWGNSTQIFVWGGLVTVTFSDIQDGFEGEGNLSYDPLFIGAVSYTSAPTSTGDYHLQSGSPAINAGSNAALPAGLFDRDGNARVSGFTVDMGAYEVQLIDLLDNGGFETAGATNAIPANWSVKNATSDKRLCKLGKPRTGLCAFKFVGSIAEKAQLSQAIDLAGVTLSQDDTLTLSAFFKGNNLTAKTKFILSVTYAGNPTPVKSTVTVKQNAGYTQVTLPVMTLGAGTVEAIKVAFKHKSTAGKVLVDDVSLIHTPGGARSRSDTLPPPPSVPNGFRGGN